MGYRYPEDKEVRPSLADSLRQLHSEEARVRWHYVQRIKHRFRASEVPKTALARLRNWVRIPVVKCMRVRKTAFVE